MNLEMLVFEKGKPENRSIKTLGARTRTDNKLNHMWRLLGDSNPEKERRSLKDILVRAKL